MSTDPPEGAEPVRGSTGRPPRAGDSRSPVGSTLSIILAVIAVIAGFFILRELTDDDGSADAPRTDIGTVSDDSAPDLTLEPAGTGDSTPASGSGAVGGVDTTAPGAATQVLTGATIAVANASGVGGSAGTMSTALMTAGYAGVGEPGNSTGDTLSESVVHYVTGDAAAQAVAQSIAADLGGVTASPMPDPRPAAEGDTETATVLVMLGTDAAGQSLADLSSASAIEPPAVIGGSTESSVTETTG
ncbi:MAG: LytR C-terminal domain-containing protein [Actinomycetota bacterium]|nr:LytR C-terminal domain-containing protein [Acidimicrobiia bacterium]MDQ3468174.1 LytR C-terminal domain-containing protein [Actinomycetota bacterium]